MLPKLTLATLPTGGGWGLGEQFARLPAAEQQRAANAAVYKLAPATGNERRRMSDDGSPCDGSDQGVDGSRSESSGGALVAASVRAAELPPSNQPADDDDCTFVDYGSAAAGSPVPQLVSQLQPQSDDNPFTQDACRWRAGFGVSSIEVPQQLPIRALHVVEGKYLWAAVADEPVCMYELSGCDLIPQRSVDTVTDVTAMAAVHVSAPLVSRSPATPGRGAGNGRGGGLVKQNGFRGGRGGPFGRGGDARKPTSGKTDEISTTEALTLWCGVTVPSTEDGAAGIKGSIALFDLFFLKDDGVISNAHGAPISLIYTLPKGTSPSSRVWTSAADGPGGGGTMKVWDGATRKTITRKSLAGPIVDLCAIPPSVCPHVWTSVKGEACLRVWDYEGRERSSARFPPNSNALKFKSDVNTLRFHPHSQLVWVCLSGGVMLVNPKTYDVVQSLPISADALEFSTTNPHNAIVVGRLLEGGYSNELRVLVVDVPISSGRTGGDATFVFSVDSVVVGQRVPGFGAQSANSHFISVFSEVPLMVIVTSGESSHQMAVVTSEECSPIESKDSASTDPARRRLALQREQQERYRQASLAKKQSTAQQGPRGLVLGVGSTSSSSLPTNPTAKTGASKYTRHGDEPDYESTENTMVVHSTVGVDGPLPFASVGAAARRVTPSIQPPRQLEGSAPNVASLLDSLKQLVGRGDSSLGGSTLAELSASRTLNDVVEATRELRSLRANDSQQKDMAALYRFAQSQRFAMGTSLGSNQEAACRAARESRLPDLKTPEGQAVGDVIAMMAVELEMWREQARRGRKGKGASPLGPFTGRSPDEATHPHTSSLLRANGALRSQVASCEAGMVRLQVALENASMHLLSSCHIDSAGSVQTRIERHVAAVVSPAVDIQGRFTAACTALSLIVSEMGASRAGLASERSSPGSPHNHCSSVDAATTDVVLPASNGGMHIARERDVAWLFSSVLHPTLDSVQQAIQQLAKGRSVLKESQDLCVNEGILAAMTKYMPNLTKIHLATPLAGVDCAFVGLEWDDAKLLASREPKLIPKFTSDPLEAATHVALLATDITTQPLFPDITFASHMMRLCEQETLMVAMDRAITVCEAAADDADSNGELPTEIRGMAGMLGAVSDELDPLGYAFRSDLTKRQETVHQLVVTFGGIQAKAVSPRLSSSIRSVKGVPTTAAGLLGGYVGLLSEFDRGRSLADGLSQRRLQGQLRWCHVYFRFIGEGLLLISRFLRAHQIAQWVGVHLTVPAAWFSTVVLLSNDHLVFIADQLQMWKRRVMDLESQLLRPIQAALKPGGASPDESRSRFHKLYALHFAAGGCEADSTDSVLEDVEHLLIKHAEVARLLDGFIQALTDIGSDGATAEAATLLLKLASSGNWEVRALPRVERFAAVVLDALPFVS